MQSFKKISTLILLLVLAFIYGYSQTKCKKKKRKKAKVIINADTVYNHINPSQITPYEKQLNNIWETKNRIKYYFYYREGIFLTDGKVDSLFNSKYQIDSFEFKNLQEGYYKKNR
jgi:hypothetical protein